MTAIHPYTILGAIDDSDQAPRVLEHVACELVRHDATDVHVLRVIDVPTRYADRVPVADEHDALLADIKEAFEPFLRGGKPCRIHAHVRVGRPHEEIVALAHEARAHLIAIGHHGEGKGLFAGNTVERVLRKAPCAVLVVQDRSYDEEPADLCGDCVQVRADSEGEVWFCVAHRAPDRPLHDVVPFGGSTDHSVGFGSGGMF